MNKNRDEILGKDLLVFVFCLTFILKIIPFNHSGVFPDLALPVLYVVTLHYSRYSFIFFVFLMGLFFDITSERLIGMSAFLWTAWFGVLFTQKRFIASSNIVISWAGFALFVIGYHLSEWAFIRSFFDIPLYFNPYGVAVEITIYPIIFRLIQAYERSKASR